MLKVEKNDLLGFDRLNSDDEHPVATLNRTISPLVRPRGYSFTRKISEDEINELKIKMDLMPGFSLTWLYNLELEPEPHITYDILELRRS